MSNSYFAGGTEWEVSMRGLASLPRMVREHVPGQVAYNA